MPHVLLFRRSRPSPTSFLAVGLSRLSCGGCPPLVQSSWPAAGTSPSTTRSLMTRGFWLGCLLRPPSLLVPVSASFLEGSLRLHEPTGTQYGRRFRCLFCTRYKCTTVGSVSGPVLTVVGTAGPTGMRLRKEDRPQRLPEFFHVACDTPLLRHTAGLLPLSLGGASFENALGQQSTTEGKGQAPKNTQAQHRANEHRSASGASHPCPSPNSGWVVGSSLDPPNSLRRLTSQCFQH